MNSNLTELKTELALLTMQRLTNPSSELDEEIEATEQLIHELENPPESLPETVEALLRRRT